MQLPLLSDVSARGALNTIRFDPQRLTHPALCPALSALRPSALPD